MCDLICGQFQGRGDDQGALGLLPLKDDAYHPGRGKGTPALHLDREGTEFVDREEAFVRPECRKDGLDLRQLLLVLRVSARQHFASFLPTVACCLDDFPDHLGTGFLAFLCEHASKIRHAPGRPVDAVR